MPELVFELGCEELPASFVAKAAAQLRQEIVSRLSQLRVPIGESCVLCTPRRLIVQVKDIEVMQPSEDKMVRGPSIQAAYDADGNPTKALQGFCRGQGVDPSEAFKEVDYVWIRKHLPGKQTSELLASVLPDSVRALTFEKSMRWSASRMRFARPIRWILAVFDGAVVPFELEGVVSGGMSRGHRFRAPQPFQAMCFDQLVEELRGRSVEPDPTIRAQLIRDGAARVSSGRAMLTDELVDENVHLTEWPEALIGTFRKEYLDLPEPVLVTAMAKHERFFPVQQVDQTLTNEFVSIRNGGEEATVREGNAWVLNARFNDARFFYEEDKRVSLDTFLERTNRIVFQEKLGTVRQRSDRLSKLTVEIARRTRSGDEELEWARLAGQYAKADLSSGLVSELTSLQGQVGEVYARREGLPEPVCAAIGAQYDPGRCGDGGTDRSRTALRLMIADQVDKLAGYLGVGLSPSGSSDPFGLRRAATFAIEAAWRWAPEPSLHYLGMLHAAWDLYEEQGVPIDRVAGALAAKDLFESRYEALLSQVRHDVLAAAVGDSLDEVLHPAGVSLRVLLMSMFSERKAFVQTATRPLNIMRAAIAKEFADVDSDAVLDQPPTAEALQSPEGEELWRVVQEVESELPILPVNESALWLQPLERLEAPINKFFDAAMVMVDDTEVRHARLRLLYRVSKVLMRAGDFSRLTQEGS